MARKGSIIEFGSWLKTPQGQHLAAWEQARLDEAVADVFGYHAVQLGLPEIDGLRNNRMPHRWLAQEPWIVPQNSASGEVACGTPQAGPITALHCDFDALPFANASLDLVVLPHVLELSPDPHQTLREVERVLVPEGRAVIVGLNPASLWGLGQRFGRAGPAAHPERHLTQDARSRLDMADRFMPATGDWIGYWRLRDWLRLLSFEVEVGRFGCWRPAVRTQAWLDRFAWMDRVGDRWWPVLGAAYVVVAVKRVRGLRLVGHVRAERRLPKVATSAVTNRQPQRRIDGEPR
jgi:SAM-dependent methyltransferase